MTPDTKSRSRRAATLAGLGAVVVIAAVLAAVTWFGTPAGAPNRPDVTSGQSPLSVPSSATTTPSGSAARAPGRSAPAGPPPATVPSGANGISAADLTGSWDSTLGVTVTFRADGTWSTIGGCNSGTGRWLVATSGALSVTVTSRTRLPCPLTAGSDGVPAGDMMLGYLQSASRVTLTTMSGRPALVLTDRTSGELTRLVRPPPAAARSGTSRPPGLAG